MSSLFDDSFLADLQAPRGHAEEPPPPPEAEPVDPASLPPQADTRRTPATAVASRTEDRVRMDAPSHLPLPAVVAGSKLCAATYARASALTRSVTVL